MPTIQQLVRKFMPSKTWRLRESVYNHSEKA